VEDEEKPGLKRTLEANEKSQKKAIRGGRAYGGKTAVVRTSSRGFKAVKNGGIHNSGGGGG